MADLYNFYLTFGQDSPLKDGWILVVAPDYWEARLRVIEQYGQKWSGLYEENDWNPEFFPQGQLGIMR